MQGTKTSAVNSEEVWQQKMLREERRTTTIKKQNEGRAALSERYFRDGGREKQRARQVVEAWLESNKEADEVDKNLLKWKYEAMFIDANLLGFFSL